MAKPALTLKTYSNTAGNVIDEFTYIDQTGTQYMIKVEDTLAANYDSIKMISTSGTAYTLRSDLTKQRRYTFANHAGRCYVANGADAMWWFDSTFTGSTYDPLKHNVLNAPLCKYIWESKKCIFAGGDVIRYTQSFSSHITDVSDSNAADGLVEITFNGTYSPTPLKGWSTGDEIAYGVGSDDSASTGATVVNGATTVLIKGTNLTTTVASGDKIAFKAHGYTHWYSISNVSFSTDPDTTLTITAFQEPSITASATAGGYFIIGGKGSHTADNGLHTSDWIKIERVVSDTSIQVRSTIDEENAAQHFIIRQKKANLLLWSAKECTNNWNVAGIAGDNTSGFQYLEYPITGGHDYSNTTLIFAKNAIWTIIGQDSSQWNLVRKTKSSVGCDSHWSIVSKDDFLAWYSEQHKGFFVLRGGDIVNSLDYLQSPTLASKIASILIQKTVDDIDTYDPTRVCACLHKDLILFAVPSTELYNTTSTAKSTNIPDIYSTGTCVFTKDSATVTGTTTAFIGNVKPGDKITPTRDGTYYTILTVDSATQLTLSATYEGTTSAATEAYVVQKRRNNRLIMFDTQTNLASSKSVGWSIVDNVYASSFAYFNGHTIYGSSINGNTYQHDTGYTLYGDPITASFKTDVLYSSTPMWDKFYDDLYIIYKGSGVLTLSWYIDNVLTGSVWYTLSSSGYTSLHFPTYDNGTQEFGGRGKSIYFEGTIRGYTSETAIAGIVGKGSILPEKF